MSILLAITSPSDWGWTSRSDQTREPKIGMRENLVSTQKAFGSNINRVVRLMDTPCLYFHNAHIVTKGELDNSGLYL